MRILISSAGRRVYLVRWFQEALRSAGLAADVIVTDSSPDSAARAVASASFSVPRYGDPAYRPGLLKVIRDYRPDLVFSLNDYELDQFASDMGDEIRAEGATVLSLPAAAQSVVADKYRMAEEFRTAGIPTPETVLASDINDVARVCEEHVDLIVKDRYGSGSSGLQPLSASDLPAYLTDYAGAHGSERLDSLVVQPRAQGREVGIDIVSSLDGAALRGVLAREKIAMRGGETYAAETVDAEPYRKIAEQIAGLLKPQGLIDVDLIRGTDGSLCVLDVNPRFGGGYPFCHAAGADVPSYYIADLLGASAPEGWDRYRVGTRSAKYVDVVAFPAA